MQKCLVQELGVGKLFAAEKKIEEFKKLLSKTKNVYKKEKKKLKPNEIIKKVTTNMNMTLSLKKSKKGH